MTASVSGSGGVGVVDTHAHLQEPSLRDDLDGVLNRARHAGVAQIIAIGVTALDSQEVVEIAARRRGVFASVGVQPNHAGAAERGDWERVVALSARPGVVAVGETGLDRYWDHTPFDVQQDWFSRHLDLAEERGLPVVIHCRNSERDIIDLLARRSRPVRGVLHSFTGEWEDALAFLELGLHLSFSGVITFTGKKLEPQREVARRLPADRVVVETDSPYLSPHPFRGRPNEPARVVVTAEQVASLRGVGLGEFAATSTANARRLFNLPTDVVL